MDLHAKRLVSRDRALDFDREVYPIGFVAELGVIIGLSQGVSYSPCSRYPRFLIQTRTHPFLHCILSSLLEKERDCEAFDVAMRYSSIPHFAHSLELLLHDTLEDEEFGRTSRRGVSSTSALRQTLAFLRRFVQFPEVVVRCARKTDVRLWPKLFSFAGQPRDLFHECMEQHLYQTAALYLRVLLNIDGLDVARRCACTTLNAVLESENLELVSDLLRFLQPDTFVSLRYSQHHQDSTTAAAATTATPPPSTTTTTTSNLSSSSSSSNLHQALRRLASPSSPVQSPSFNNRAKPAFLSFSNDSSPVHRSGSDPIGDIGAGLVLHGGAAVSPSTPLSPYSPTQSGDTVSSDTAARADDAASVGEAAAQDTYIIDLLLSRYVRKLLTTRQLRLLVAFSKQTTIPLRHWLTRERTRAAALASEQFALALSAIHQQFSIALPTDLTPAMRSMAAIYMHSIAAADPDNASASALAESLLSTSPDAADSDPNFSFGKPAEADTTNATPRWRQMLQALLHEMCESQCTEWSLILATILMDVKLVSLILQYHMQLWPGYSHMLQTHIAYVDTSNMCQPDDVCWCVC
jgi:RAB6A-GEF complex partner protein 1